MGCDGCVMLNNMEMLSEKYVEKEIIINMCRKRCVIIALQVLKMTDLCKTEVSVGAEKEVGVLERSSRQLEQVGRKKRWFNLDRGIQHINAECMFTAVCKGAAGGRNNDGWNCGKGSCFEWMRTKKGYGRWT